MTNNIYPPDYLLRKWEELIIDEEQNVDVVLYEAPTPLSPTAQAVLESANLRHGCIPAAIAAIALRAVAAHCYFMDDNGCEMVSVIQLHSIAAELENTNG